MLTGYVTVILGSAIGMTKITLGVHIDRSGKPDRRRLSTVAAHLRACTTIGIIRGYAAFCVVGTQEPHVYGAGIMVRRAGASAVVAGIAHVRDVGQRVVRRMRSVYIRIGAPRRR